MWTEKHNKYDPLWALDLLCVLSKKQWETHFLDPPFKSMNEIKLDVFPLSLYIVNGLNHLCIDMT